MAFIMVFALGGYNYVSATEITSSNDDVISLNTRDSTETIKQFGGTATRTYTVNFTTTGYRHVKVMVVGLYTSSVTGTFDCWLGYNQLPSVPMNGSVQIIDLGWLSANTYSITFWPNDFYSENVIAGQVYYYYD